MKTTLHLIDQWNSSRLELFKISSPDKNLKFYGVMRFFYEISDKFHTKCLRVSSDMKVKDLLPILLEKFYVTVNFSSEKDEFQLFERSSSIDRLLAPEDMPLLIQLLWCKDDKEGVFVLKRTAAAAAAAEEKQVSPRARKDKTVSSTCLNQHSTRCLDRVCSDASSKSSSSKQLSKQSSLISTPSFLSRTISNPESLMRLKRKAKLEEKLKQISKSGNVNAGGTLKIYGENLNPLIPYKSLLLSIDDTASFVVREILDKYGLENEDENDYCLVNCTCKGSNGHQMESEEILHKSDSPLRILLQSNQNAGLIRFKVIRCPPHLRRRKKSKNQCPTPDVCRGNPIRKANNKKSDQNHNNIGEIQCHSRVACEDRLIPVHNNDSSHHNDSNNGIYSTPPACETPLNVETQYEPEKRPLPSYEESMSALRSWHIKHMKTQCESNAVSYRGSTDSFSLSSDYQENSSYNTDSCDSQNHQNIGTNDRADDDVVIISDLDSHLSRHLPVQITYFKSKEDLLLDSILLEIKPSQIKFKLASAYVLHLMVVDIIRLTCINRATIVDQELIIGLFIDKVASKIRQSIMQYRTTISIQAYWLANCTEFLHLLKNNILLSQFNRSYFDKYYDLFADNAQWCFQCISFGFTDDMVNTLSVLLREDADDPSDKDDFPLSKKATDPKTMSDLIRTISSCMTVLQQCHVNPALIIQIISRIFHLINCWIFNSFIENPSRVTRTWARTILNRIERIRQWSERHELLLAADCYFQQSLQVCKLLLMGKTDIEILYNEVVDMVDINSIQLRYLLENYVCSPNETRVPQIWIDFVVSGANQVADKVFEEEGIEISLKEKESLNLPLLLPEDGYHVDSLYGGVPVGFIEYLEKLHKEWCFYKISHQDIHFDWLCQKKVHHDQPDPTDSVEHGGPKVEQQHIIKQEERMKTYSVNRHQLRFSDFKANVYNENLDNINNNSNDSHRNSHNNNESAAESGIETYRHQSRSQSISNAETYRSDDTGFVQCTRDRSLSNYKQKPPFDFSAELHQNSRNKTYSDSCSTGASILSEIPDDDDPRGSHSKRLKVIQDMRKSVERNIDRQIIAQEQFQSVINEADEIYSKKLWRCFDDLERNKSQEIFRVNYQQMRTLESSERALENVQNKRESDFLIQSERMKNICELESQLESIDKYSLLKSSTLPARTSIEGSQPPISFVPASLALRNSLNYPPRTRPKPRINHLSTYIRSSSAANICKSDSSFDIMTSNKPRSLSSDRFYSRMSDGMENLSFQEKVQLFEFAINRSSH